MLSPEYKASVSNRNLLRTRIMLKDSLVVDPTFAQFNEMYGYAEKNFTDLLDIYDDGFLEKDESKWNKDVMNEELSQLVANFSRQRIEHLKKVVASVLKLEAEKITNERKMAKSQQASSHKPDRPVSYNSSGNTYNTQSCMSNKRKEATDDIIRYAKKIEKIVNTRSQERYKPTDIDDIASAAKYICKKYKIYENSK